MDTVRYVFAVLVVTFLPPGVAWWLVVHPFVGFWRRVGARATITVMSVAGIGMAGALMTVRDRLVGRDLGTRLPLVVLAALLLGGAAWIALRRRRHLTMRILAGVPELEREGDGGTLLTEGMYGVIRHPRYVEVALGTVAYALFANHLGSYVVAAGGVSLLHLVVLLEERELSERFGAAYEDYRRRVPRYLPGRSGRR